MKLNKSWIKNNWPTLIVGIISIIIVFGMCFYNLGGITNQKLSAQELATINSSSSGARIWSNPLFLPVKLAQYGIIKLDLSSVSSFRAISALYAFLLVVIFYLLAKTWFSAKIAWIASLMLLTCGLFLNYSRLATPDVLVPLGLLGLMWSGWWVFQSEQNNLKLVLSMFILTSSFYIPGLIWFTLLVAFIQRRHIKQAFSQTSKSSVFIAILVLLTLLLPLFHAIISSPGLLLDWLAIPRSFNLHIFIRDFFYVPASLVVRAQFSPVYNLGRLPYLDILTVALVVLGSYAFLLRLDLVRTRTLIGSIIIAWFLIALDNSVKINLLLPLIYMTVSAGIMFLLQQWYSVFPKNPIARAIGITLILGVVSISIFYNTTRYFVAWSNNPISSQAFEYKIHSNLIQ